jgi:hypothetical protein
VGKDAVLFQEFNVDLHPKDMNFNSLRVWARIIKVPFGICTSDGVQLLLVLLALKGVSQLWTQMLQEDVGEAICVSGWRWMLTNRYCGELRSFLNYTKHMITMKFNMNICLYTVSHVALLATRPSNARIQGREMKKENCHTRLTLCVLPMIGKRDIKELGYQVVLQLLVQVVPLKTLLMRDLGSLRMVRVLNSRGGMIRSRKCLLR